MSTIPAVTHYWLAGVTSNTLTLAPEPVESLTMSLSEVQADGVLYTGESIDVSFDEGYGLETDRETVVGWHKQDDRFIIVTQHPYYGNFAYSNSTNWPSDTAIPLNTSPLVLSSLPCFLKGTLVRTERGEVAVEDLQPGDRLVTLAGDLAPLRWIGHRQVTERRIAADPVKALPVRFAAGSLGQGMPARDLWLSPDHCLHHDGILVQAKELLNGTTVTQMHPARPITYYHLLMDRHEVIFAEGAESETYRPCGNVMAFANAGDFPADVELNQPRSSSRYPVKKSGPRFEALKAAIAAEAAAAGACIATGRAA